MLCSNLGVCFNWNALVAVAETTNKLSLQMKFIAAHFRSLQVRPVLKLTTLINGSDSAHDFSVKLSLFM